MSAPQLFRDDDKGSGQVVGDGAVTAEQADDARHAAANGPEHAITTSV
jgi:ferredoxin